ncbi:MAG: FAD-binding oxidoreductase [bacterium]
MANTTLEQKIAAKKNEEKKKHFLTNVNAIEKITHDVLRIVTEKPEGYVFIPGQATDVSIKKPGWSNELRPFTFTNLPHEPYLEFTIKTYPSHKGMTNQLLDLKVHDKLILSRPFGTIKYAGEGVFIAGGAGITPFISILKDLKEKHLLGQNRLIFANKTRADIILEQDLNVMMGPNFINILSDEKIAGYHHGMITKDFLLAHINNFNQYFYLCGPPAMLTAVSNQLHDLGVNDALIIKEKI